MSRDRMANGRELIAGPSCPVRHLAAPSGNTSTTLPMKRKYLKDGTRKMKSSSLVTRAVMHGGRRRECVFWRAYSHTDGRRTKAPNALSIIAESSKAPWERAKNASVKHGLHEPVDKYQDWLASCERKTMVRMAVWCGSLDDGDDS